jgi:hypothetical protein
MKKYVVIFVVMLAVLVTLWIVQPKTPDSNTGGQTACTADAKLCPDGSAVGRTGPNCEFAECPTTPISTVSTTTLAIGDKVILNGSVLTLKSIAEDSRCPVDVQCIQAGTVRVNMESDTNGVLVFTLGEPQVVSQMTVTLTSVVPAQKKSTVTVPSKDYRFTFSIVPVPTHI